MTRHRRIGRVRQAEFLQAAAPAQQGCVRGNEREEAVEQHLVELGARDLVAQRAGDQLRAARLHDDRRFLRCVVAEQRFFREPARMDEAVPL